MICSGVPSEPQQLLVLAGSSTEWREASAFNVTTKEHGPATLLMHPDVFKGTHRNSKRAEARLKIVINGQKISGIGENGWC